MFNSIRTLLSGTESLAVELRLRTCIELARNVAFYKSHPSHAKTKIHSLANRGSLMSANAIFDVACLGAEAADMVGLAERSFEEAVQKEIMLTAKDTRSSTMIAVMGLASVTGITIETIYPEEGNRMIECFQNSFLPRDRRKDIEPIKVMWTSTGGWKDRSITFKPNHFVPLVKRLYYGKLPLGADSPAKEPKVSRSGPTKIPIDETEADAEVSFPSMPPLCMPRAWYGQIGRVSLSNEKRDMECATQRSPFIEGIEQGIGFKIRRSVLEASLDGAIRTVDENIGEMQNERKRKQLEAVKACVMYLNHKGPLVETQKLISVYRQNLSMSQDTKTMSITFFEMVARYLSICQIYLNNKAYIIEDRLQNLSLISATVEMMKETICECQTAYC